MILQHPRDRRNKQQGFTLTELLVAMAMVGIVMAAVYSTYKSQQDTYVAQEQVAEMQQNLRASLYQLARDLRMAGFNPTRSPNVAGFVAAGELPDDPGTETSTTPISLAFTIDKDRNGSVNADDPTEQIAYKFNNTDATLERFMYDTTDGNWKWRTVADNIQDVDFVYLDGDGNPVDPTTATNLPSIRSVEISIVARTKEKDRNLHDYRRRTLTTAILCRNMGT